MPRVYLKPHSNGTLYAHWTEGRRGFRRSTKTKDLATATKFMERLSAKLNRPTAKEDSARLDDPRTSSDAPIYPVNELIIPIDGNPVEYLGRLVVDSRSRLSALMLRYDNAVQLRADLKKLEKLKEKLVHARADLSHWVSMYEDMKAIGAGEPLAPPDSMPWPRRYPFADFHKSATAAGASEPPRQEPGFQSKPEPNPRLVRRGPWRQKRQ